MPDSSPIGRSNSREWARPALKIALIYTILGLIWIEFSDRFLTVVIGDPGVIARLQTFKGWFYVSVTGLLLYFLVKNSLKLRQGIENALRQRNHDLDLANQFGQELNSTLELEEVIAKILHKICLIFQIASCSIWLVDTDTGGLVCHEVANPEDAFIRGWRLQPGQGIVGWVISQRHSVVIADAQTDQRHFSSIDQQTGVAVRSILAVPLIVRNAAIGVIEAVHMEANRFQPADLVLIELLAVSAASAVENAHLYGQLQVHTVELEDRVAIRTQELENAYLELQELDHLKSKFVSDVSHELRTPVTNLIMYLDLLDRGSPEKTEKYMAVLKDQANRLAQLIESILDLSRLDISRNTPVEFKKVNLNDLVEQIIGAHTPRANMLGLELIYRPAGNLPPVRGVPGQLVQVVTNLLANALNYTPTGQINVSTYYTNADTNRVYLEIQDTGIGIPAEDIKYIFSRFYRGLNVSQSNLPGSGLGLAIAGEIIERHEGKIEVESSLGVGSVFRVWLPASD